MQVNEESVERLPHARTRQQPEVQTGLQHALEQDLAASWSCGAVSGSNRSALPRPWYHSYETAYHTHRHVMVVYCVLLWPCDLAAFQARVMRVCRVLW